MSQFFGYWLLSIFGGAALLVIGGLFFSEFLAAFGVFLLVTAALAGFLTCYVRQEERLERVERKLDQLLEKSGPSDETEQEDI